MHLIRQFEPGLYRYTFLVLTSLYTLHRLATEDDIFRFGRRHILLRKTTYCTPVGNEPSLSLFEPCHFFKFVHLIWQFEPGLYRYTFLVLPSAC